MPTVKINKTRMYYEILGEGESVVLISGLGGDYTVWDDLLPKFTKSYRCLVFDNRGVGKTDKPKEAYSIKSFAKDINNLMKTLEISTAHIVGISMGGAIAQELAINYPGRVGSLTLISTWPKTDNYLREINESWIVSVKKLDRESFWREHLLWCFTPAFFESRKEKIDEVRESLSKITQPVDAFVRQIKACINHDTLGRLNVIRSSTLIIVGDEDILTPLRFSTKLHQHIRSSELVVIKGAGHSVTSEKPDEFTERALEFLKSHKLKNC